MMTAESFRVAVSSDLAREGVSQCRADLHNLDIIPVAPLLSRYPPLTPSTAVAGFSSQRELEPARQALRGLAERLDSRDDMFGACLELYNYAVRTGCTALLRLLACFIVWPTYTHACVHAPCMHGACVRACRWL